MKKLKLAAIPAATTASLSPRCNKKSPFSVSLNDLVLRLADACQSFNSRIVELSQHAYSLVEQEKTWTSHTHGSYSSPD